MKVSGALIRPTSYLFAMLLVGGILGEPVLTARAAAATGHWVKMPVPTGATLKQVSVGSSKFIWGLDTTGTNWQWNGKSWDKKVCCAMGNISATADGGLWATHPPNNNRVLRWNVNRWDDTPPAGMTQVAAVSKTTVWALDGTGSNFLLSGNAWVKKGCCVTQLATTADGSLFAAHPANNNAVLHWDGTRWDEHFPAGMVYLSVANGSTVWGLDGADKVYKLNGSSWLPMPGSLHNISAAADGTVWGLDAKGVPYSWAP